MIKKIKNIAISILIVFVVYLLFKVFKKKEPEIIKIPVLVEVEVPGKVGSFPPIEFPTPKKEHPINKELMLKYQEAKDSLEKLILYKEAIKERSYKEKFKDGTQTIEVSTKVQGKLLNQSVEYEIYPDTITKNIQVPIELPKKKTKVFAGGELIILSPNRNPALKANLMIQNKKDNIWSIGYDTQKNIYIGYNIKL